MTTTGAANGTTDDEIWSVALPNGDVRRGTLDQLDEAFQAGQITEKSLVLGPNATEWTRLGDLLGLDMPAATPSFTPPPVAVGAVGPESMRPVMMDLSELVEPPRPRSRMPIVLGTLGSVAAVVAVIAFAISSGGDAKDATKAAGAAAVTATQKPTAAPKPLPSIGDDAVPQRPILTEAQKKALQEADDARARLIKASKPEPTTHGKKVGVRDSAGFGGAAKPGGKCTCKHGDPLCSCM